MSDALHYGLIVKLLAAALGYGRAYLNQLDHMATCLTNCTISKAIHPSREAHQEN